MHTSFRGLRRPISIVERAHPLEHEAGGTFWLANADGAKKKRVRYSLAVHASRTTRLQASHAPKTRDHHAVGARPTERDGNGAGDSIPGELRRARHSDERHDIARARRR